MPPTEQALLADDEDGDLAEEEEVESSPASAYPESHCGNAAPNGWRDANGRRKRANIRLEEYSGEGTTKKYKYWNWSVKLSRELHGPTG